MADPDVVYGDRPETVLHAEPRRSSRVTNHVLLGTWLKVLERSDPWLHVATAARGPGGWVRADDVAELPALKIFFVDVGQGDGAIVEAANGRMLIDGGPSRGFHRFLRSLYGPTIRSEGSVHFDAVVVSHPDLDHYNGLTRVLGDTDFTFGTIYHNGIIRYRQGTPQAAEFDLGNIAVDAEGRTVLTDTFSTLAQLRRRLDTGSLSARFAAFWQAVLDANAAGRLRRARRLTNRDQRLPGFDREGDRLLRATVLGPVPTKPSGHIRYVLFADPHGPRDGRPSPSHTRNGHSIVLRLDFGAHSMLFAGDLNTPAQRHLLRTYGDCDPFQVDIAKACHHGSSDFTIDFLRRVRPQVNVFSSGDNKSFDHPMADALGAAGKHSRGDYPLLFSTELARATSGGRIHYGLINARSNGSILAMAQMKEQHRHRADVWDSYTVPWAGRFP